MSTITALTVDVEKLFGVTKAVPRYQRDYEWQPKQQVAALLEDLFEHFGVDTSAGPYGAGENDDYLLGQVVFTKAETPEVIDGQQRLLTLYLLLAALRSRLRELDPVHPRVVQLTTDLLYLDSRDQHAPRIKHHDPLAERALIEVVNWSPEDGTLPGSNESLSHRRLIHAYNYIVGQLRERLPADATRVNDFFRFIWKQVKLIQTETEDVTHALVVFERANDRGKPLDPADLLKALVFQNADPDAFERLDGIWKEIQRTIEDVRNVRMIDFLRWYHLSVPDGFYSTKRTLYREIRDHSAALRIDTDPDRYLAHLRLRAKQLHAMASDHQLPGSSRASNHLAGIAQLGGFRQKQHWPLLLTACDWQPEIQDLLAHGVERLLLAAYVTDLPSQTLERRIRSLTERFRGFEPPGPDADQVSGPIDEAVAEIRTEGLYDEKFPRLNYEESKHIVRYVLVKIHDGLYRLSQGGTLYEGSGASDLYTEDSIEHVWPKSQAAALAELDPANEDLAHRLGNLVLLNRSENASGGVRDAETKLRKHYKDVDGRFVVARNLHERAVAGTQGSGTFYNRAVALAPTGFESWGPAEIRRLADEYRQLLDRILPPLGASS